MQLEAGYRFCAASRFHLEGSWPDRLRLNSGVDRRFTPLPTWRPATAAELALLIRDEAAPAHNIWRDHIVLFAIPEHLRSRWWDLAAEAGGALTGDSAGCRAFAQAVADFAEFKKLPLPVPACFDVVAAAPDFSAQASAEVWRLPLPKEGSPQATAQISAMVNLGDEPSSLVFLNLSPGGVAKLTGSIEPSPGTSRRFVADFPDYPLVRLMLQPGEGVWLPAEGIAFHGYPRDKQEIDVWLAIRPAADRTPELSGGSNTR